MRRQVHEELTAIARSRARELLVRLNHLLDDGDGPPALDGVAYELWVERAATSIRGTEWAQYVLVVERGRMNRTEWMLAPSEHLAASALAHDAWKPKDAVVRLSATDPGQLWDGLRLHLSLSASVNPQMLDDVLVRELGIDGGERENPTRLQRLQRRWAELMRPVEPTPAQKAATFRAVARAIEKKLQEVTQKLTALTSATAPPLWLVWDVWDGWTAHAEEDVARVQFRRVMAELGDEPADQAAEWASTNEPSAGLYLAVPIELFRTQQVQDDRYAGAVSEELTLERIEREGQQTFLRALVELLAEHASAAEVQRG